MRNIIIALFAALCLALCVAAPQTAQAEDPLPPCATDGDKDGDGVPDADDSDETDHGAPPYGDGDGIPDCQE